MRKILKLVGEKGRFTVPIAVVIKDKDNNPTGGMELAMATIHPE